MNLQEFFHMGGYAAYVWPCFAMTLAALFGNLLMPWLRHKRLRSEIARSVAIDQQLNDNESSK